MKPGDTLTISTPNNLFALAPQAQQHLLIAGGIGITPFLSHIPELEHSKAQWQLHYCSPSQDNCAFYDELLQHPSVDRIHLHLSSAGTRLDLSRLLADVEPGTHIYTCGPAVLNDAVREAASLHRLDSNTLHFEQFALEDKSGDAFTLILARSGREFVVPEEMTILQVIENNKAARVECLCREGVCGTCETTILEGKRITAISISATTKKPASKACLFAAHAPKVSAWCLICSVAQAGLAMAQPGEPGDLLRIFLQQRVETIGHQFATPTGNQLRQGLLRL